MSNNERFAPQIKALHDQVRRNLPYWHEQYPEAIHRAMLRADDEVMDEIEELLKVMIETPLDQKT